MTLRLLDEAKAELNDSAQWYEERRPGLGVEFIDAVERALTQIEEHPHRFMKLDTKFKDREVRRCVLKRFPYLIAYEVTTTEKTCFGYCPHEAKVTVLAGSPDSVIGRECSIDASKSSS